MQATSGSGCRHHDAIEERLREKRDRLTKLEMEAEHMKEKLDLIVIGQEKVIETVNAMKSWQTWLMGACGAVALIYSVVSAHWAGIVRVFGG